MAVNPRFLFDMTYSEGPSMTAVSQSIFVNGELITRQLTEADKKRFIRIAALPFFPYLQKEGVWKTGDSKYVCDRRPYEAPSAYGPYHGLEKDRFHELSTLR